MTRKDRPYGSVFSSVSLSVSRILYLCRHVSSPSITIRVKRLKGCEASTVLHTRMYLAVSAGLNRIVSVRNTMVTHDGRYPLRFQFCPPEVAAKLRSPETLRRSDPSFPLGYLILQLPMAGINGVCSDFPHNITVARLPNKEHIYYTIYILFCTEHSFRYVLH